MNNHSQPVYTYKSIALADLYGAKHRYFDLPECQREFIWNIVQQQKLIDTFLRGMPMPPIAYVQTRDDILGTKQWLVDGQQRFTTIIRYFDNLFSTATRFGPTDGAQPVFPGKRYLELSEAARSFLNAYEIPVVAIQNMAEEQISLMFRRWQGGAALTQAEKLFSYDGTTKTIAVHVTEHPYWRTTFRGETRRRQPFQAGIHLMLLSVHGPFANLTSSRLLDMLKKASDPSWSQLPETIQRRMDLMCLLFDGSETTAILHVALQFQAVMLLEEDGCKLKNCAPGVLTPWFMRIREDDLASKRQYGEWGLQQLTKVNAQREFWSKNYAAMAQLVADSKRDDKRSASMFDKISLWNRQTGKCAICGKDLRFSEGVSDHVIPYANGGKTNGSNLVMVHRTCHDAKHNPLPRQMSGLEEDI